MIRYGTRGWQQRSQRSAVGAASISRQWLLSGALALALVGVTGRLAYWQIARDPALAAAMHTQQQPRMASPSPRGTIVDRNGTVLALTVTRQVIVLDPLIAQSAEHAHAGTLALMAQRLSTLTNIPVATIAPQLNLQTGYHELVDGAGTPALLTDGAAQPIQMAIDSGALPGTVLQQRLVRVYPQGAVAGTVLGFVRRDDGVGQYGVEEQLNADLNTNPDATVRLTLDANLQYLVESELAAAVAATGAQNGTVIIADPMTGAILALASTPGFDPNHYDQAQLADLGDPAISAVYDPGSTMKAITMAAGLESGVITPQTTLEDDGTFVIGDQAIHNYGMIAWGHETMTQVLAHSSNVGAAWVAVDRLGQGRFDQFRQAFGFGAPTGVDLPGEAAGVLPPLATSATLATLDLAEQSFGESIGVTPLQMVMAYSAIANGGLLLKPQIVQSFQPSAAVGASPAVSPQVVRRVISPSTAATLTQMLVASARQSDASTGLIPGVQVAAKTGTSTPDPADPNRTYASVLGYAPAEQPRFVVLVKLDQPRTSVLGGEAAGPLWRTLMQQLLAYDQGGH